MDEKYQLIIVGGGAAAFAGATKATELRIRTGMINTGLPIGGTCVNVGCVPSKHLLAVSNEYFYSQRPLFDALKNGHQPAFDFRISIQEKRRLVEAFRRAHYQDVLRILKGVEFISGWGRFLSPTQVQVNDRTLTADNFLIATGSRPAVLPFPGIEGVGYITSREAMELEKLPSSMIVIGAGPTGLELGQMFLHFGSKVTVLEKTPQVLPRFEPEIAKELQRLLEEEGMEIHCACNIQRVWQDGETRFVEADIYGEKRVFQADQLLLATGVMPNTDNMGLEEAGVRTGPKGFIDVDEHLQTSAPHIYAAGDVLGKTFLETPAAKGGRIAIANAFEDAGLTLDYDTMPAAVFTNPQVAMVGLTEEEQMRRYGVCACRSVEASRIPKAKAIKDTRGLIKMGVYPESGKIAGVHILSSQASELIHEAVLAVKFGLTVHDIIDTVHVFPTMSEGIKLVAQAFTRDISTMACCIE